MGTSNKSDPAVLLGLDDCVIELRDIHLCRCFPSSPYSLIQSNVALLLFILPNKKDPFLMKKFIIKISLAL